MNDTTILDHITQDRKTLSAMKSAIGCTDTQLDTKLQSMRRRGLITYTQKTGWQIVPKDQPNV